MDLSQTLVAALGRCVRWSLVAGGLIAVYFSNAAEAADAGIWAHLGRVLSTTSSEVWSPNHQLNLRATENGIELVGKQRTILSDTDIPFTVCPPNSQAL